MQKLKTKYDVAIIGGGHNGLVAASYLGMAGLDVVVLEKNDHLGGAAYSRQIFPDYEAYISEYSYLLSLFSEKIIKDLGLAFGGVRRDIASYTPTQMNGNNSGLLISNNSAQVSLESFQGLTGGSKEYKNFLVFSALEQHIAKYVWPTLLQPMVSRATMRKFFKSNDEKLAWNSFIEDPISGVIEKYFKNDLVCGLIFTDAKIGIHTFPNDPRLLQNKTFLYHIIGGGTGEWRVPIGGMGSLSRQLTQKAKNSGVDIITNCPVKKIDYEKEGSAVHLLVDGRDQEVGAKFILSNVAPKVLSTILKEFSTETSSEDEGSVFKINMLLNRLPKLRDKNVSSKDGFSGTFHIDEGYGQMIESYNISIAGNIPQNPPGEMYCHTLTDGSILSKELRDKGFQTLTLFGLDMPYSLFAKDNETTKSVVLSKYLDAISNYITEPIENCIAKDNLGNLCIETKSPVDLENELGMPSGNIFHNALSWPFVDNEEYFGLWGVETNLENVFICGAGAMRGGCVSGIPGHNAAMKVLEILK